MSINYFDVEELLSAMYDITDEQRNNDFDFDELCYEKFDIGFEEFLKVITALLPLTPVAESALTGKKYHAFIKDGLSFVKQEAAQ
ncbi:hypothetical protein EKN38_21215 [Enterobacter sp. WCHEn045836]|uniref:hypothetical protein n=1 Tax=Enterobacter sp. WCHEn045836 TaxID=2497434 RepID=UPI000F83215B|nr:hypothetical protein [Enterobacter sp. WCHEn045836]RTP98370.1 hypothetical protein EKN38_21215 [Enterobacter sp. WCHEn045836]